MQNEIELISLKLFLLVLLVFTQPLLGEPYNERGPPYEGILVVQEVVELEQDPSCLHLANLLQNYNYKLEHTLKRDELDYHESKKKALSKFIQALHRLSKKTEVLELRGWATELNKPVTVFVQDKKLMQKAKKFKPGDLLYCKTTNSRIHSQLSILFKIDRSDKGYDDNPICFYFLDVDELPKNWHDKYRTKRSVYRSDSRPPVYSRETRSSKYYLEATQLDVVYQLTSKGKLPTKPFKNNWTIVPIPDISPFSISLTACDNDASTLLCASIQTKDASKLVDIYDITFEVIEMSSTGRKKVISPKGGIHMGGIENGRFGHYDSSLKSVVVVPVSRNSDKSYTVNVLAASQYSR